MVRRWLSKIVVLLMAICCALPCLAAVPWLPFGPDGGFARRFAEDPHDPSHVFLGAANGWIYESRTQGASWKRVARVGRRDDLVIDSIYVDPTDSRHLVVGAWVIDQPDGGIFLSADGGITWRAQAEMRGQSVRSLAASLSDPKTLVAGTLRGIFRSTDGGAHWTQISPPDSTEIHNIESVAIDPVDANIIYAGTWHLPWKTTDGGANWSNIKEGIIDDSDVFSIVVDPKSPNTVFASACSGIYKSDNAGALFHKVQGIPSTARRTRVLLQDPNHLATVFAGTTEGLFRSDDEGKTWVRTTGPDFVVNDVSIDAADSRRVLIATDRGGVFVSEDGGDTFSPSNSGFSSRQVTALMGDIRHPARLYAGVVNDTKWGGVFASENGGVSWVQQSEGLADSDVLSLGQSPDGTVFTGTPHGLYRQNAESNAWSRVESLPIPAGVATEKAAAQPGARAFVPIAHNQSVVREHRPTAHRTATALAGHRKSLTIRSATTAGVKGRALPRTAGVRSTSHRPAMQARKPSAAPSRATAAKMSTAPPVAPPTPARQFDGAVFALTAAGSNLLAATSNGLLSSPDNGVSWTTVPIEAASTWRILAAARQDVVGASMTGLWFSADSGATWIPIALPDKLARLTCAAVEPSGTVWAGGAEGVFVSSDGGAHWDRLKNLYVTSGTNLFYDEPNQRMLVTAGDPTSVVFSVQMPTHQVTYASSGWALRMARPVGDHLAGATRFDGVVIQPRMVAPPEAAADPAPAAKP